MAEEIEEKMKQFMSVRTVVLTSLVSALGFVLALFWNDAVRSAIEKIVPAGDTTLAKFEAAIIVTVIVVIVIYFIVHSQRIAEKRMQELVKKRKALDERIGNRREEAKKKILKGSE